MTQTDRLLLQHGDTNNLHRPPPIAEYFQKPQKSSDFGRNTSIRYMPITSRWERDTATPNHGATDQKEKDIAATVSAIPADVRSHAETQAQKNSRLTDKNGATL